MQAKGSSIYARAVREAVPSSVFAPAPARALWLLPYAAVVIAGTVAISHRWGGWPVAVVLSLLIGHSFAGAAFVGHETLHGSVVRNRRLRWLIGWLAFVPFTLSPTLWVGWHNQRHHRFTAQDGRDPDSYPTLAKYRESRALRIIHPLTPRQGHWLGALSLLLSFTAQGKAILIRSREFLGFTARQRLVTWIETLMGVLLWVAVSWLIGARAFLFAFGLPLMIGNVILVAYILTNHSLSPLTQVNDPLLNSMSVTAPRVIERLHLNFGYHVEHHLFPAMSPRHAPLVRKILRAHWPEQYQSMPFLRAIRRLFSTARVYKDSVTLIDPPSGREYPTLTGAAAETV
jgi:fatty acid desaturase